MIWKQLLLLHDIGYHAIIFFISTRYLMQLKKIFETLRPDNLHKIENTWLIQKWYEIHKDPLQIIFRHNCCLQLQHPSILLFVTGTFYDKYSTYDELGTRMTFPPTSHNTLPSMSGSKPKCIYYQILWYDNFLWDLDKHQKYSTMDSFYGTNYLDSNWNLCKYMKDFSIILSKYS